MTLWLAIPVMVFRSTTLRSSLLSPLRSVKSTGYGRTEMLEDPGIRTHHDGATVMFFVFSCVLSLTPADLAALKSRTSQFCLTWLTTLTHRYRVDGSDYRDYRYHQILPRPYLGAREGFNGMVIKSLRGKGSLSKSTS